MKSTMINAELPQQTSLTIDQALQQAIAHHQAGQLQNAERLYRAILQTQPNHPDANHKLGVLAVQVKQPTAGLFHLKAALEANPNQGQYWLSYIDALIQTDQTDAARQVLEQGRQRGLQGEAVEALASRLDHLENNATPDQSAELECAIAHREAGRYKEAALVLQNWFISNPQDASAYALLAQVLSLDKQDEPAWLALTMALSINPTLPIVQRNHARLLLKQQKPDEALQAAQAAYHSDVTDPENQLVLAAALGANSQNEQAFQLVTNALQSHPNYAEAYANRALLKLRGNDHAGALADVEKSLSIKPHLVQLWGMVGSLRYKLKNLPGAIEALEKAIKLESDNVGYMVDLGELLRQAGKMDAAIALLEKAVLIAPDNTGAWVNLGTVLQESQHIPEAKAAYAKALEIAPEQAEVASNLGALAKEERNWEEALRYFNQALEIKPDFAEAHSNLGITLKNLGRLDEAEASYRRALQVKPDFAEAHSNLGAILQELGRLDEAEVSCRRALQVKPDFAEAHSNLGATLQELGRLDEAEVSYRRVLQIKPDYAKAHSNLLFCRTRNAAVDAEMLFFEHCRFGEQFETPFRANCPQFTNSRNPERSLRIGFVSADLRNHAVAHFIESVLACLSSYPQLSLYAYSNHVIEDAVTQRIREYFTHWYSSVGLSDATLTEKIRADSIDILIDLSGHTAKNRLLTFARKPAPVQASWIGYPGTTGLQAIDYYLADRFFLPHEKFRAQFTEKIVYLPALAPFMPSKKAPPVNALPALSNGYITFGSFNHLSKLNPLVITSWSQLLRALPESRIVLGAMPQDGYNELIDWFAQEGIVRERVSFHPKYGIGTYLALHHQMDICLDTFPYNGGTTTSHALWMGVPTLTMTGSTPASRVGATLLSHVGLEGFVALDAEDFVKKGLHWAKDVEALARIRTGLRARFEQSTMGQPALIAEGLQRALRIMWQRWCAGLPAESFEVSLQDIGNALQKAST